jgi:hypothetical protein
MNKFLVIKIIYASINKSLEKSLSMDICKFCGYLKICGYPLSGYAHEYGQVWI